MKLHLVLAAVSALVIAQTSYAWDCGCTAPIGPPVVHQSHGCCSNNCCRLFPTFPQLLRGVGRVFDALLPCHGGCYNSCCTYSQGWKGYRHGGCGGCGSCCNSPILPSCRPRPCAARLWPSLGCCASSGCGCGSSGSDYGYSEYDHPTYSPSPAPHYSHPEVGPEMAPTVPPDIQNEDPFTDDPVKSTRYAPRRSNSLGMSAPAAPKVSSRPIKQASLNMTNSAAPKAPTLAQPKINKTTSQPSNSTTRIVSRISPASHEEEIAEPQPLTPAAASPLRARQPAAAGNGLPVNPLR